MVKNQTNLKVLDFVKSNAYSDEKFFTSEYFKKRVSNLAKAVTDRYKDNENYCKISVSLCWGKGTPNESVACTDNNTIYINMNSDMLSGLNKKDRALAIWGLLAHELGHCLYTDFAVKKNFLEDKFDYSRLSNEAYEFYSNHKSLFFQIMAQIRNILEDGYIEMRVKKVYTGSFKRGLNLTTSLLQKNIIECIESGKADYLTYLLAQVRNCLPEEKIAEYPCLAETEKILKKSLKTPYCNMTERCNLSLDVFSAIYETFIKNDDLDDIENNVENASENNKNSTSDENQNQNSRGFANNSNENNNESSDALNNSENSNSSNNSSSGSPSSPDENSEREQNQDEQSGSNEEETSNEKNGKSGCENGSESENSTGNDVNGTSNKKADNKAQERSEDNMSDDNNAEEPFDNRFDENPEEVIERVAKEIAKNDDAHREYEKHLIDSEVKNTEFHKGVDYAVNVIKAGDKTFYDNIMNSLKPISKQATNKVRDAVLQKKRSLTNKRQERGNRLDINAYVKSLSRDNDTAIFMNSKKPSKTPLMAVSVIVDCSGSMSGDKISSAKYATMIIEDFCRTLKIPFSCIGHSVYSGKVVIDELINFDSVTPLKDRYNLTKLTAHGCNRDGFAIRYALNKIKYRKEPFKIMIVISDGLPSDYGFYEAKADITDIYSECDKRNIELLAFAIGDDVPALTELYGKENLVDCRDLKQFPKTISKVLAERSKKIYG